MKDSTQENFIEIRVQQRSGRKFITTISNLDQELNFNRLLKEIKKRYGCNGMIPPQDQTGGEKVLQLQGNMADHMKTFLVSEELVEEKNLKMFGI